MNSLNTSNLKNILICGFVLGVGTRSLFQFGLFFYSSLFIISFLLLITGHFYKRFLGRDIGLAPVSRFLLAVFAGVAWFHFFAAKPVTIPGDMLGKDMIVRAVVSAEPEKKEKVTQIVVSVMEGAEKGAKILVSTANYPEYNYGDILELKGKITEPKNFDDSFDYVSYLANRDIGYTMDDPKISLIGREEGAGFQRALFRVRDEFVLSIKRMLPEPHASLLAGILIGAKESLGKDLSEDFRVAGLSHMVVLSGYNLTVISDVVIRSFGFILPRIAAIVCGSVSIVLFVMMTGGGAASVRAMIMALIGAAARVTGRLYDATNALIMAGLVMVIWDPRILVFDLSFQLSFLATLGLIYVSPFLSGRLGFLPEKYGVREAVATTLGAQAFTTPLILYKMGTFSVYALPANLLVLPFIPWTMFFGFLGAMAEFVSYYLAFPFSAITWFLLSYELWVAEFVSSLPYASVGVGGVFGAILLVLGGAICYFVVKTFLKRKRSGTIKTKIGEEEWEIMEM